MKHRLESVLLWLVAMLWHLWRFVSLRPAYGSLGASMLTTASFVGIYFAAGVLRWSVLDGEHELDAILVGLGIGGAARWGLLRLVSDSKLLLAAVFGVSASLDLIVSAAYLMGFCDSVRLGLAYGDVALELTWMVVLAWRFKQFSATHADTPLN